MINIVCVYKTGGDFTEKYVFALYNACRRFITQEQFNFVCFTDDLSLIDKHGKDIQFLGLFHDNWEGWWNKFEIFSLTGTNLYFDLDTIIVANIDYLVKYIKSLHCDEFIGVRAFNPIRNKFQKTQFNSGAMAWNGDYRFVLKQFNYEKDSTNRRYCGDQDRISEILRDDFINILFLQDIIPGIYSYKRHCKSMYGNRLPEDASIICFHGRPRPHEVLNLSWVKEKWNPCLSI